MRQLSDVHLWMCLFKEGIQQAKEASEIYERLGGIVEQADCLIELARLLHYDKQLDAAEEAASRAMDLLRGTDQNFCICHCHHVLGIIRHSKGEVEKATHHLEIALEVASSFN